MTDPPAPPSLPDGAPEALREFTSCRSMSVDLDTADFDWLPRPPGVTEDMTPTVTVHDGWTPTTATVSVSWGPGEIIGIELPVGIVDGRLSVNASRLGFGIGPHIDRWVSRLNTTLAANQRELDEFRVRGTELRITKRVSSPAHDQSAIGAAGPVPTSATPRQASGTTQPRTTRSGRRIAVGVGVVLVLLAGAGLVWGLTSDRGGGDTDTADEIPTTASTTTALAIDEAEEPDAAGAAPIEPEATVIECGDLPSGSPTFQPGSYASMSDLPPCDGDPAAFCESSLPCVFNAALPIVIPAPNGQVTHNGSEPDALTGAVGLSQLAPGLWVIAGGAPVDQWFFQAQADCNGNVATGRTAVTGDALTLAPLPLFRFGTCALTDASLLTPNGDVVLPVSAFGNAGSFDITAAPIDVIAPDVSGLAIADPRFMIEPSWVDHALTIRNSLSAAAIPPGCAWSSTADVVNAIDALPAPCSESGQFWVFAASVAPADADLSGFPVATGGGYLNPDGVRGPSISASATALPLFGQTVFPCGSGNVGDTVCADGPAPEAAGLVAISMILAGDVPLEPTADDTTQVVTIGGGPSYTLAPRSGGWTLTGSATTRARAIIRGDSITLVVPEDELPVGPLTYIVETTGQVTVVQPAVNIVGVATTPFTEPPSSTPSPSSTAPPPATAETIETFYEQLSASIASGDLDFAIERLHPLVDEAYPGACPSALASFVDSEFQIDVLSSGRPEPWVWTLPDGRSFAVDDAIAVDISLQGRGQTGTGSVAHLAVVDGEYRWFTFCS